MVLAESIFLVQAGQPYWDLSHGALECCTSKHGQVHACFKSIGSRASNRFGQGLQLLFIMMSDHSVCAY